MNLFRGLRRPKGIKETAATTEVNGDSLSIHKVSRKGLTQVLAKRNHLIAFITLLVIMLTTAGALMIYTWDNECIVQGVVISNIEVSGLTKDQARERLEKDIKEWLSQPVKLEVNGERVELSLETLGTSTNIDQVLYEAYNIGRKGSIFDKAKSRFNASYGVNFDLIPVWDDQKLTEALKTHLNKFNITPIDASFRLNDHNLMDIRSEQLGRSVNFEALLAQVKKTSIFEDPTQIKVEFKEEKPSLSATELENVKITGLVASYTSKFDPSQVERSENVRLAAKALDGALIKPGETLSFNGIVGERTVEKGYKDAYIIVDGEFVSGLGGGICQVSSTLYNAGLLANLGIKQRSNHDLAISYVPLGQDATVAYPDLDLKLNNDTDGYLLVRSTVSQNSLTIDLYGKLKPGQEVVLTDKTESVIPYEEQTIKDTSLNPGQHVVKQLGQPGYIVSTFRTIKKDGTVIKTEDLGKSTYDPIPKIVAVGP